LIARAFTGANHISQWTNIRTTDTFEHKHKKKDKKNNAHDYIRTQIEKKRTFSFSGQFCLSLGPFLFFRVARPLARARMVRSGAIHKRRHGAFYISKTKKCLIPVSR
jgi:hypothetical protein